MKAIKIQFFGILVVNLPIRAQELLEWQNQRPAGYTYRSVHCFSYHETIMVGTCGTIVKTEDGEIAWDIKTEIRGEKNYLHNIFFVSEDLGWAVGFHNVLPKTLKVYDVPGKEVATPVDEYKPAGRYEVAFDVNRLARGGSLYKFEIINPETGSGQGFLAMTKMIQLN